MAWLSSDFGVSLASDPVGRNSRERSRGPDSRCNGGCSGLARWASSEVLFAGGVTVCSGILPSIFLRLLRAAGIGGGEMAAFNLSSGSAAFADPSAVNRCSSGCSSVLVGIPGGVDFS